MGIEAIIDSFLEQTDEPDNRRKRPIREAHWDAVVTSTSGRVFHGKTINVSLSGVMCALLEPLDVNTKVKLSISGHHNGRVLSLVAVATVQHRSLTREGFNHGMKFITLNKSAALFLKQYEDRFI
jgi:hypothetical protein